MYKGLPGNLYILTVALLNEAFYTIICFSSMPYLMYPDKHGNNIVFTSEDNLWLHDLSTKKTTLLLSNFGTLTHAFISRDGKKVAFRCTKGAQGPISEIYVISIDSSDLKRVTYFSSSVTDLVGWASDSSILVVSDEGSPFMRESLAFEVNIDTLAYQALNLGPTSSILKTEKGNFLVRGLQDLNYWKRYRGGLRGKVYFDSGSKGGYKLFLQLESGVDTPTYMNNRLYFLTDKDGSGNIFSVNLQGKDLKQHTKFKDFYARNLKSDGKDAVFQKGGKLYLFHPAGDKVEELKINPPLTGHLIQRRFVDPTKFLEHFEISPDGKSVTFVVRGKGYEMSSRDGPVHSLDNGIKGRTRLAKFLTPSSLLIVNDESGEDVLYETKAGKRGKALLENCGLIMKLYPSPSGKFAVASNNRFEVFLVDVEKGKSELLDRSEDGEIDGVAWHPAEEFIALTYSGRGGEASLSSIMLMNVKTRKKTQVTSKAGTDYSPSFDPSGRYLYYISDRSLDPVYDKVIFDLGFSKASKPYIVTLDPEEPSPLWNKLGSVEQRTDEKVFTKIGVEGIERRSLPLPVEISDLLKLEAVRGGVLMLRVPVEGALTGGLMGRTRSDAELLKFDLSSGKQTSLIGKMTDFRLSRKGDKVLVRSGSNFTIRDLDRLPSGKGGDGGNNHDENATGTVAIDLKRLKCEINPRQEWKQMIRETWRLMREYYWKEEKINKFWDSVYKKYMPLAEQVFSRFEMSDVLKEMQGETGTSHSYERGGELYRSEFHPVGKLGAELAYSKGKYVFKRVYSGDPSNPDERSPLHSPGIDIREGDVLESINEAPTGEKSPPGLVLENLADSVVEVKVSRNGKKLTSPVRTMKGETYLIYRDWVERNRAYVHKKFGGAVGYIHIPDMMAGGFAEFHRQYKFEWDKPSLIVDVRFNGGGHVSGLLIEKVSRRLIGFDLPRRGKYAHYPDSAVRGGIVAITNEFAGSDGDIFSHSFKLLGLGELIGERTWGGVVGINPRTMLVDGTMITQPQFSFWFKDVGFGVENYGTDPTIRLDYSPADYLSGKDPQLDRAGEIALALSKKAMKYPSK